MPSQPLPYVHSKRDTVLGIVFLVLPILGLAVILSAWAIVSFVIARLGS